MWPFMVFACLQQSGEAEPKGLPVCVYAIICSFWYLKKQHVIPDNFTLGKVPAAWFLVL